MGYTHYYHGGVAVTGELAADARAILAAAAARGVRLQGLGGAGEPEVTATRIAITGDPGDDGPPLLFVLGEGDRLNVVKTRRLPYDEAVTAILVAACVRTGLVPASDGRFADWAAGIALYEQARGPVPPASLEVLRRSLDRDDGTTAGAIAALSFPQGPGPAPATAARGTSGPDPASGTPVRHVPK